jgi:hypothetical protein
MKILILLKKLMPLKIHICIYSRPELLVQFNQIDYSCEESKNPIIDKSNVVKRSIISKNKTRYSIEIDNQMAHVSYLINQNLLARQLGFNNCYVIGECHTEASFRGRGLYGITVQHILDDNPDRKIILFISPLNHSSIRGVEKVGLTKIDEFIVYRFIGLAILKRRII